MRSNKESIILSVVGLSCQMLTSCSLLHAWDRSYTLRQWEKLRLSSEAAFLSGEYAEAEHLMASAVDFASNLGSADFRLGNTLALTGDAARRNGSNSSALSFYEHAVGQLERSLVETNDPFDKRLLQEDVASVSLKIADLKTEKGDLSAAARSYLQAMNIYKQWLGNNPAQSIWEGYGHALLGLAIVETKQGNMTKATDIFHTALDSPAVEHYSGKLRQQLEQFCQAAEKSGATAASVAAIQPGNQFQELMLAAKTAIETKDFITSKQKYAEAIAAGEKVGVDKERLGSAYHGLAKSFDWLKQKDLAERNYLKELEIRESLAGQEEHIDFLLAKLARLRHAHGDDRAALAYMNRLIKLRKESVGEESTDMGEALTQLTAVYLGLGQKSEARRNALRGWTLLAQAQKLRGDTLTCMDEMSSLLLALGQFKESAAANDRITAICRRKNSKSTRCNFAVLRTIAISVQQARQLRDDPASATEVIATHGLADPESRYDLIDRLESEVELFATNEQLHAAAYLASTSLALNPPGSTNPYFLRARLRTLKALSAIETKLGNKDKASRFESEIDRLHWPNT